jgi:hypothetical protein
MHIAGFIDDQWKLGWCQFYFFPFLTLHASTGSVDGFYHHHIPCRQLLYSFQHVLGSISTKYHSNINSSSCSQSCQEPDKILFWDSITSIKWVLPIQSIWTGYPQTANDTRNHIHWCSMDSTQKMTHFGHFWVLGQKYRQRYTHSVQNISWSINILLLHLGIFVRVISRGFQKGIICQDWVISGGAMVILRLCPLGYGMVFLIFLHRNGWRLAQQRMQQM